jgi:hypothetical protein
VVAARARQEGAVMRGAAGFLRRTACQAPKGNGKATLL